MRKAVRLAREFCWGWTSRVARRSWTRNGSMAMSSIRSRPGPRNSLWNCSFDPERSGFITPGRLLRSMPRKKNRCPASRPNRGMFPPDQNRHPLLLPTRYGISFGDWSGIFPGSYVSFLDRPRVLDHASPLDRFRLVVSSKAVEHRQYFLRAPVAQGIEQRFPKP